MADDKKYYWLKLKKDFFKRHDIQIIEAMPNGKDYILFYLKMLVESVDHKGVLKSKERNLASNTNTNKSIVHEGLQILIKYGMVEVLDEDFIYLPYMTKEAIHSSQDVTGRDRNTPEYKEWRKSVFERDGYTCQMCFKKGLNLNAHHKNTWAKCIETRFDIDNGISLCKDCHKKVHRELRCNLG